MLKSTHRPRYQPPSLPPSLPLRPPWTEHRAPTGHIYYYNIDTKESTYTRPVDQFSTLAKPSSFPSGSQFLSQLPIPSSSSLVPATGLSFHPQHHHSRQHDRRAPYHADDRPKSKRPIPGCAPWLLVKTKLRRRFVHNPITKESYWKFPKDIIGGIFELEALGAKRKEVLQEREGEDAIVELPKFVKHDEDQSQRSHQHDESHEDAPAERPSRAPSGRESELSEEYEEVEVTDSELGDEMEPSRKRQRLSEEDAELKQDIEFNEEDMVRQLAYMGDNNGLEPDEYGDHQPTDDWQAEAHASALTEEEAHASFMDLLDDFRVSPYTTWENIVSEGDIIQDDRYTLLPNMRRRKDVFTEWSAEKIRQYKLEKDNMVKQNPRISFLAFLEKYATPKLFWVEFRRKFKKEQELKDTRLSEKEREKLYRDFIHRLVKVSESQKAQELRSLLESLVPHHNFHDSSTIESGLPSELLSDIRYVTVPKEVREPIIKSYLTNLPTAREMLASTEEFDRGKTHKQAEALHRRSVQVGFDRRRREEEVALSVKKLRAEEHEIQKAMHVGRSGLREHMQDVPPAGSD